jgi:hypothetical protein
MNIYLQHPIHGRKIATMELEAENDEQNGWTRYNDEAPKIENTLITRRKPTRQAAKEI